MRLQSLIKLVITLAILLYFWIPASYAKENSESSTWYIKGKDDLPKINFYFFWSRECPHCKNARPFVKKLNSEFSWIQVFSHDVSTLSENSKIFEKLAKELGATTVAVPAFFFCEKMHLGFTSEASTGKMLKEQLQHCYKELLISKQTSTTPNKILEKNGKIHIPLWGELEPSSVSLPFFTLILAGVDAFNPCAFFVLLFLLSILVHTKDRKRMIIIGGIFVFFSGLIYFLFMAAWLNLFLLLGEIRWVTLVAGIFAVIFSLINIKDFFWFKKGVSLSIPESAKPGLFQRMRNLTFSSNLPSLMIGAILLALAANSYELICTSGFPMIFTRVLTLSNLSVEKYYFYLAFYNIVYVIPLMIIVFIFVVTLGSRKLTEREGRISKLISGLMMLSLGLLLIINPSLLNNLFAAIGLLFFALVLTFIIVKIMKFRNESF